jgi:hypothetical protein
MTAREDLEALVAAQFDREVSKGARALADAARAQRPGTLAVLFYGSCLRDDNDDDAVLDLYVLVDSYETTYDQRLLAWLNRVLPPNVFFLEADNEGVTVRAKYAVVALDSFVELMADTTRESYFWGRFAQPSAVVYTAAPEVGQRLAAAFATAVETFVRNALALVPARFSTRELWAEGLSHSYQSELRAEGPDRSAEIFAGAADYYEAATRLALTAMPFPVVADGSAWRADMPAEERARSLRRWRARRILSKLLTALRVLRNGYTAEGGVDYVMWKIERHSGHRFDEHWRDKPVPLFALLREMWRAWRAGAFR